MTVGLSKALVALVVSVLAALGTAVGSGAIGDLSTEDWVQTAAVILGGTALVAVTENVGAGIGATIRAIVGAATAGITAWQVAFENDHLITQGEWISVVVSVITALGAVYQKTERRTMRLGPER